MGARKLKKIALSGGEPVHLCDVAGDLNGMSRSAGSEERPLAPPGRGVYNPQPSPEELRLAMAIARMGFWTSPSPLGSLSKNPIRPPHVMGSPRPASGCSMLKSDIADNTKGSDNRNVASKPFPQRGTPIWKYPASNFQRRSMP
jgi:hypothetical protein